MPIIESDYVNFYGTDITERKRAEQALRESETRFRTLFEEAVDGLLLADLETKKFHAANPRMCQMLGYSEEELKRLTVSDIHTVESVPRVLEAFAAQAKGDIQTAFEIPVRRKDGTVFYADINSKPVRMDRRQYLLGIFHDATERRKMQEAILKEQKLSENLINSSIDGIHAYDHQCRYIIWNPAMEQISGMKKEDVLGRCAFDVFPFLKETGGDKYFYDALAGKTVVAKSKPYKIPETGQQGFFDGHYAPLFDEQNNIIGGLAVIHDVTEQKRAEEILRESEDKFRHVFDNSVIGKSITFPSGEMQPNKALCEMLGYSREELKTKKWQDVTHPDDIKDTQNAVDSILSGQKDSVQFFKRYIHKNGSVVWADVSTSLRRDNKGKPLYLMTSVVNITERKQAEESLHVAEERFSKAFHASPDAMTISRMADGVILEVNDMWKKTFGYSRAESVGTSSTALGIWSEQAIRQKAVQQLQETGSLCNLETELRHKTGEIHQVSFSCERLKIGGEQCLLSIIHDITKRKQAEEKLRESEIKFRAMFENSRDAINVSKKGMHVFANPAYLKLYGCESNEEITGTSVIEHIAPSHRQQIIQNIYRRAVGESVSTFYETRGMKKDGTEFDEEINIATYELNGEVYSVAIIRDITERKQVEQKILEYQKHLRQLAAQLMLAEERNADA